MMAQEAIDARLDYPISIIGGNDETLTVADGTAKTVVIVRGNVLEHTLTVLRNPFQDIRILGVGSTERILILIVFFFHVYIVPKYGGLVKGYPDQLQFFFPS